MARYQPYSRRNPRIVHPWKILRTAESNTCSSDRRQSQTASSGPEISKIYIKAILRISYEPRLQSYPPTTTNFQEEQSRFVQYLGELKIEHRVPRVEVSELPDLPARYGSKETGEGEEELVLPLPLLDDVPSSVLQHSFGRLDRPERLGRRAAEEVPGEGGALQPLPLSLVVRRLRLPVVDLLHHSSSLCAGRARRAALKTI